MAVATKEATAKLAPVKAAKEIEVARLAQALRRLHDLLPLKERQQSLAARGRNGVFQAAFRC